MVISALPAMAVPADSPPILTVGNTTVSTSDGAIHYWKDGGGSYVQSNAQDYLFSVQYQNAQGYILHLNNVDITTYDMYGFGIFCATALTLTLEDGTENSITARTVGACASNELHIEGNGSLTVRAGEYSNGIYSNGGGVMIHSGNITVDGQCGIYAPIGDIVLSGGTIIARGSLNGLYAFDNVIFNGGSLTALATDSGGIAIETEYFTPGLNSHFKFKTNTSATEPAEPYQFYPDTALTTGTLANSRYVSICATHTITSSANDNGSFGISVEGVTASSAALDDTVSLSALPDTGYSHVSWSVYQTSDLTVSTAVYGNIFTMPDYPVTVAASFIRNTYAVDYYYNYGAEGIYTTQTDIPHGEALTAPTPPTRDQFNFNGWYKEAACVNPWSFATEAVTGATNLYAGWTPISPPSDPSDDGDSYTPPARIIAVTEVSASLFANTSGKIEASANMNNAFSNSVEVKVTDTAEDKASFGFGKESEVYPFDISLYIKGTDQKTQPKEGYTVTISLPIPENLLSEMEKLSVVHKSNNDAVTILTSRLEQKNGIWYLVFEATEFSPYAIVLRKDEGYDESVGIPYYLGNNGDKLFIGFAANGKYIAPEGVNIFVMHNSKYFSDVSGHWAFRFIDFVTEREVFLGNGSNTFSPNTEMTRAMFATVVGRLFERSYGELSPSGEHAFADCDYEAYYGKYIDWASENSIISGYGNGRFGPDDPITREQMAAILHRFSAFLGLPADSEPMLSYPDANTISDYAKQAALYCQTTGIIDGRSGGFFAPRETASRAEVATMIQRFILLVVKQQDPQ